MIRALSAAALVAVLALPAAVSFAIEAEPSGISEETQAKLARARAKAGNAGLANRGRPSDTQHSTGNQGGQPGLPNCGVNIGNSVGAPKGQAPKEIIVVVKGDVINANNKCK